MDSDSLHCVIQDIDNHIASLIVDTKPSKQDETLLRHFLELRNDLLKKYSPDPKLEWEIQNEKTLKILKLLNWKCVWK